MDHFRYTIVKQPQFGNIQRLRAVDTSWINVDSFTSNQIHLGQVRYIHNTDFPVHDDFKVRHSLNWFHEMSMILKFVFFIQFSVHCVIWTNKKQQIRFSFDIHQIENWYSNSKFLANQWN